MHFQIPFFIQLLFFQGLYAGGCVSRETAEQLQQRHRRNQLSIMDKVVRTLDVLAKERCHDAISHASARRAENDDSHMQKAIEYCKTAEQVRSAMYHIAQEVLPR